MSRVIERASWPPLPDRHVDFLGSVLETLQHDPRIVAIALGGSFVTGEVDEHSDLDFVLAVEPGAWPGILDERDRLAAELGPLLEAFAGDHVGEPRLLICLYGPPLLHVDLKFVSLEDAGERVEDPAILWERDDRLSAVFAATEARFPVPDPGWIEARFWIWVHYTGTKIERGELFEALDALAYFRKKVLGPLGLERAGVERPQGVRRIEAADPAFARRLADCVAPARAKPCLDALEAAVELYRELRADAGRRPETTSPVEQEAMRYIAELGRRIRRS